MKLTVHRDRLRDALKAVAPAVARGATSIPALNGVRIDATKTVAVTGANLDLTLATDMAADVDDPGVAVIPHRWLSRIVAKLGDGPVTVDVDDTGATITGSGVTARLPTLDADTWPKTPEPDADAVDRKLTAGEWSQIVGLTSVASPDTNRPILTAVHFGDGVAVASDSYRCGWVDLPALDGADILVPATSIAAVDPGDGPIVVTADGGIVQIATDTTTMTTRTIHGEYPKWRSLVPDTTPHTIAVGREQLEDALAVCATLDGEGVPPARLAPHDNGVEVSRRVVDVGEISTVVDCDPAWPLTVAFGVGYLASMLDLVNAERVTVGITDALKPAILAADDTRYGLIMPVRS